MNISKLYINNVLDVESLLPLMDNKCGFKIEFPDLFDYSSMSKLICSRGKISHRMIFALYYVWNITQNVENVKECSILEIGAGLGRTAYYAYKFGFKKYTIVDIISTGIMQFHYNYHLLGSENVSLFGEDQFNTCFLNLMPADKFNVINERYDIICNFDGLTEYGFNTAINYINKSMQLTKKFLSINHTFNPYNFTDLYKNNNNIKVLLKEECNYRIDYPRHLQYYKEILEFI